MEVADIGFRWTGLGIHDQWELVENVIVLRSWTITLYGLLFGLILTLYLADYSLTSMHEFHVLQQLRKIKRYTNVFTQSVSFLTAYRPQFRYVNCSVLILTFSCFNICLSFLKI